MAVRWWEAGFKMAMVVVVENGGRGSEVLRERENKSSFSAGRVEGRDHALSGFRFGTAC